MTLARFARMCEVLENQTPTLKAKTIAQSMSSFEDKANLIGILALEFSINNIGNKRAMTWIANALGIFDEEVVEYVHAWGDIGEAVFELDSGNNTDSEIGMGEFQALLSMDCSRINSNSYTLFAESLNKMSAREKKWFIRYWVRKPRNGVNNKVPLKAMKIYYVNDDIEKYYQYNTASSICDSLDRGTTPESRLVHGQFVNPMLAKARKGKERPTNYIVDIKYDGNRYQIHKEGKSVIIFNRKGKVVTDQYPDVVDIVKEFEVNDIILDTEIYPVNPDGSPAPHKLLGKRVHKKDKAEAMRECPVKMVAFDCLSIQEVPLIESNLKDRLTHLSYIPGDYQAEIFADSTIQSAYNIAIDRGFEGIMIKDADMAYQPGKRSKGWLKYKPPRISLDVVITFAKYGDGKRSNVYGTYGISVKDKDKYVNVGKVGTGFSDWDLDWLTTELRKNVDYYEGETYYFLPRIVLEVTSDLVTTDSDGNIGLRFPRCVRIRQDKYPADIDTIDSVKEMM
jgi:ATP-dependent DNA ligase I